MGPWAHGRKTLCLAPYCFGKFENGRMTGGKIYTRPGREANNFGICTLSIRLSSNLGKIHTSGVNRMNIWLPGPGDTAENSKRHGLRFWTSADFVLYIIYNSRYTAVAAGYYFTMGSVCKLRPGRGYAPDI